MKVYKFIFIVGVLNLGIPFLGIPFVYKNYILIFLASITIGFGLILRAIEYERRMAKKNQYKEQELHTNKKTIEEVVDMQELNSNMDLNFKKRAKKSKIVIQEEIYE